MDFVYEVNNFIPPKMSKLIIDLFEKDENKEYGTVAKPTGEVVVDKTKKDSVELCISDKKDWEDINNYISTKLCKEVNGYKKYLYDLFIAKNIEKDDIYNMLSFEPLCAKGNVVQRITLNTEYRWHCDTCFIPERRVMSCIVCIMYLNNVDDEYGGKTEFINGRIIKPEAGKLIMFPATWDYFHKGQLVKTDKYILTNAFYKIV